MTFTFKKILILTMYLIGISLKNIDGTTLVIATGELPPYISEDPKEGFLTDLFKEIGYEMDITFEFRFMPWKRCELSLENNEAWGAIPFVRTPERENKFYFSEPLFTREGRFFYYNPKGMRKQIIFNELSDLKKYRIGGVRGYYYTDDFQNAGLRVVYVASDEQNFIMLKMQRVDLIPADEAVGLYIIHKLFPQEIQNFFTLAKPLDKSSDYLISSKHYPDALDLLNRFNMALIKIKKNGKYQEILDKYGIH